MRKAMLAAMIAAVPGLAMAQSQTATTPSSTNPVAPNLGNPQAQGNMTQEPPNARPSTNNDEAKTIPTPVLNGRPNSPVPR